MKKRSKKGLSTVVATLIIILLVLVATGIIWVVIRNMIIENKQEIEFGKLTLSFNIENARIECGNQNLTITVKRNSGRGEFVGLGFTFESGEESELIEKYFYMNEFEIRTFNFTLVNITSDNVTKIKIYPIFRLESGKETFGDMGEEWENLEGCIIVGEEEESIPINIEYGLLYNGYVTTDARGVAPLGWHVPTYNEYSTLRSYLGTNSGYKAREMGITHWTSNLGTDIFGFKALGAGVRRTTGEFVDLNNSAFFKTSIGSMHALIQDYLNNFIVSSSSPIEGGSVRLIRDNSEGWIPEEKMIDYDGNVYDTVQIGTQIWTKQNLAVTHYNNGDVIPEVTNNAEWAALTTGALCAYDNNWFYVFDNCSDTCLSLEYECGIHNICGLNIDCGCCQDCTGKICGTDGCGGTCGGCSEEEVCSSGICVPSDSFSSLINYGLLYNWYAVGDSRGLCPEGWHVSSDSDWQTLLTTLGGWSNAGGKLKEKGFEHWNSPNTGATNEDGFSAFGTGYRMVYGTQASFYHINSYSYFVVSDDLQLTPQWQYVIFYNMEFDSAEMDSFTDALPSKSTGLAVRCVRDNSEGWVPEEQVIDYDENIYNTIQIGAQIWLKQNLAVTHYRNGDAIPEVTDNAAWTALTTGGLCAYNNDWDYVFSND